MILGMYLFMAEAFKHESEVENSPTQVSQSTAIGLLSAALVAVSVFQIRWAWEVRMYSLGTGVTVFSSWAMFRALHARKSNLALGSIWCPDSPLCIYPLLQYFHDRIAVRLYRRVSVRTEPSSNDGRFSRHPAALRSTCRGHPYSRIPPANPNPASPAGPSPSEFLDDAGGPLGYPVRALSDVCRSGGSGILEDGMRDLFSCSSSSCSSVCYGGLGCLTFTF